MGSSEEWAGRFDQEPEFRRALVFEHYPRRFDLKALVEQLHLVRVCMLLKSYPALCLSSFRMVIQLRGEYESQG